MFDDLYEISESEKVHRGLMISIQSLDADGVQAALDLGADIFGEGEKKFFVHSKSTNPTALLLSNSFSMFNKEKFDVCWKLIEAVFPKKIPVKAQSEILEAASNSNCHSIMEFIFEKHSIDESVLHKLLFKSFFEFKNVMKSAESLNSIRNKKRSFELIFNKFDKEIQKIEVADFIFKRNCISSLIESDGYNNRFFKEKHAETFKFFENAVQVYLTKSPAILSASKDIYTTEQKHELFLSALKGSESRPFLMDLVMSDVNVKELEKVIVGVEKRILKAKKPEKHLDDLIMMLNDIRIQFEFKSRPPVVLEAKQRF